MYPSDTGGCATLAGTELASDINRPFLQTLAFDKDSDEAAQFSIAFPKSWNEGTITFQPFFTACLLYTSPSPRDNKASRMPSSA